MQGIHQIGLRCRGSSSSIRRRPSPLPRGIHREKLKNPNIHGNSKFIGGIRAGNPLALVASDSPQGI